MVGCGDLGTQVGLEFVALGDRVTALRRRAQVLPSSFDGVSVDLADGLPELPALDSVEGPDIVVVALTSGGRDEAAYRAVFLDALGRVLSDVRERGWAPKRALFVSSTSVCAPDGPIDESTPAAPTSATGQVLREAENAFLSGLPGATAGIIVRPSGIYGPGREWFIDQVRRGEINDPSRMTHRIHRDDLSRAIVHLMTMPKQPEKLYLVTDDEPAIADEVAAYVADYLNLPWKLETRRSLDSRLMSNARLRATGFEFTYPTYREGYPAVIDGKGVRHG